MQQHRVQSTSSSLSSFLTHESVEISEEVLFVSSLTLEGVEQLCRRLEEVTCTALYCSLSSNASHISGISASVGSNV